MSHEANFKSISSVVRQAPYPVIPSSFLQCLDRVYCSPLLSHASTLSILCHQDTCLQKLFEEGRILSQAVQWMETEQGGLGKKTTAALLVANMARNGGYWVEVSGGHGTGICAAQLVP